jgi:predicted Zn-ribbon and HTH transcriptional regulator
MNHRETVLKAMKDAAKPLQIREIVELTGLDIKEVEKARKELKKEALIFSPKRCLWQASDT